MDRGQSLPSFLCNYISARLYLPPIFIVSFPCSSLSIGFASCFSVAPPAVFDLIKPNPPRARWFCCFWTDGPPRTLAKVTQQPYPTLLPSSFHPPPAPFFFCSFSPFCSWVRHLFVPSLCSCGVFRVQVGEFLRSSEKKRTLQNRAVPISCDEVVQGWFISCSSQGVCSVVYHSNPIPLDCSR
jgi:hypothetical protein